MDIGSWSTMQMVYIGLDAYYTNGWLMIIEYILYITSFIHWMLCIMRHSTMLQTAGCLRHVAAVEEKKEIVADYL